MKKRLISHLIVFFILMSLIIIIIGKSLLSSTPSIFLLVYGTTVTSMVFVLFLVSLWYKDPSEKIRESGLEKNMEKPFISIVLAVHNEEKVIIKCVDSLINSDYKNREIIVVDDASTDKTPKILREKYGSMRGVKIIALKENVGKKRAIGKGLLNAKGEIFVFTDSDCIVAPDAITKIIEIFVQDENVGAVSGHGRALNSDQNLLTRIQDSWYETQYSIKKAYESIFGSVTCVSGPLAVFRRAAIYNYIPAWENDTFLGSEFRFATDRQLTGYVLGSRYIGEKLKKKYKDSDFVTRENYPTKNWKVLYCKSAKVWTVVPDTMRKAVRQQIRWKKSFIRNLFFTGKFYWRKPVLAAVKFYLGVIFVFVGPFIALRHLIYLPLNGDPLSGVYYLGGIFFIGSLYAIMFKLENPDSNLWMYRPFMSLISTVVYSWLIFYSILTLKRMVWHR